MSELIVDYFGDLFSSRGGESKAVMGTVKSSITAEQNESLCHQFNASEVVAAVNSMHQDKSQSPDGFNPCFYQNFWPEISTDVINFCLQCLNNCDLPDDLNDMLVVLILKIKKPDKITYLRPIFLCNMVVKIMMRVIINRLKMVLNSVVLELQRAFIPACLITNNDLIAFEVSQFIHRKTHGKVGFSSLKINMFKAYDRIE